jgi:D-alanyl-D-alanine carboxypeptidase (penicillin-binding protein 5/6)
MVRQIVRFAVWSLLATLVGGSSFSVARLLAPLPRPVVSTSVAATWTPLRGAPTAVAPPAQGSLAVAVTDALGTRPLADTAAATARPIASVTKTMTALVVLEVHPLSGGDGPVLTMTATDEADYRSISASGGSTAPVRAGEQLTERQLLLGLMLPSADNLALTLARWVDGSVAAFVQRLNQRAASLGMARTHFADPDGLSTSTTSTAADLVILGERALADASLLDIVSTQSATLPDGTVLHNLDVLLSTQPDWIGIKTGWTPQAGGCLLFAARRSITPGADPVTVVGAVLGQPPDASSDPAHPELGTAVRIARTAVTTAFAAYAAVTLTAAALPASGLLHDADGHVLAHAVGIGPATTVALRVGQALELSVTTVTDLAEPVPAGTVIGTVTARRGGVTVATWRLVTSTAVVEPSPAERLLHW